MLEFEGFATRASRVKSANYEGDVRQKSWVQASLPTRIPTR